jgi:hypothetical protein
VAIAGVGFSASAIPRAGVPFHLRIETMLALPNLTVFGMFVVPNTTNHDLRSPGDEELESLIRRDY